MLYINWTKNCLSGVCVLDSCKRLMVSLKTKTLGLNIKEHKGYINCTEVDTLGANTTMMTTEGSMIFVAKQQPF
jgi:hypothetical protein